MNHTLHHPGDPYMKSFSCQGVFNVFPCVQTNGKNAAARAESFRRNVNQLLNLAWDSEPPGQQKFTISSPGKPGLYRFFFISHSIPARTGRFLPGNNPAAQGTKVQTLLVMSSWTGLMRLISMVLVVVSSARIKPTVPFYSL